MKTIGIFLFLLASSQILGQASRLVVPVGHTEGVTSAVFSPDGKYVLTGSVDNTAKLWDLSGREIQTFFGHKDAVTSVAFSPDGKTVLTGSRDNTAKLWDLNGREANSLKHKFSVTSVAYSPDGLHVLTSSEDKIILWDLQGRKIQTFNGHTSDVTSVAFSPDGKRILTASKDKTARLWDLQGHKIHSFEGHTSDVTSVAFSPDGQYVLTGSWDKTAKLWTLEGREIQVFKGHLLFVLSVSFSPDGQRILTSSADFNVKIWNLEGYQIQSFKRLGDADVVFSPNGQNILTHIGMEAKLWDLQGRKVQSFTGGHASTIESVAFSNDGHHVLMSNWGNTAKLWDLKERGIITLKGHKSDVTSVAFSPDGQLILTGSWDKTAKLWTIKGREIQTFKGDMSAVRSVSFSPDGYHILTGNKDGVARLWDLDGHVTLTLKGQSSDLLSVAFSPDGQNVLTGSLNGVAKLWNLQNREVITLKRHTLFIFSVSFSPDGKYILTGGEDNTAKLWDFAGSEKMSFIGHTSSINSVVFSPDSKSVLTGSEDGTAKLWDLTGREIGFFKGHTNAISSLTFSPNGQSILTGSIDKTVKLWDTKTGQELVTLIALDSADWVVTTPSGLFDASPGAMKLMYYVQGLDVIELDQLKERYYEPGLLAKIMGFDNGELRNVANFDKVALYPDIAAAIEKDRLNIALTQRSSGIGKLSLFINGKEVQEDLNPKRLKNLNLDLNTFAKYYRADTANILAIRAYNAEGWLKSQAYELTYQPPAKQIGKTIPHLYALVVGTSNYSGEQLDLRFADLDAEAMAKAFQSTGGALFGSDRTQVRLLSTAGSNDASSKTNIRQAFLDIAAKATPSDVLVVYFSGHGLAYGPAEKEQFYYLTKDIGSEDLSDPVVREQYTISSNEFTQWLTAIPAQKQVMILDACNAGKVVESLATIAQKNLDPSQIRALDRMKDRTGMFILTGSAADKVSYEASQYGQGLLTYSLLQGMSGLALTEDKRVDVMTLFQYSRDKVPELAKGIGGVQTPVLAFPNDGASFDIGIVNAGVKIPVAQVKPVFIRNNFTEELSFDDLLGLTDALETYLRSLTIKGAQAELIFVDVKEYESAYSMKGRYTIKGDAVEVRGRLFKGKESKGEFQVVGKKSDVLGLVAAIIGKVAEMVEK